MKLLQVFYLMVLQITQLESQLVDNEVFKCEKFHYTTSRLFCDSDKLYIERYYCLTYSAVFNNTVYGHCLYNLHSGSSHHQNYLRINTEKPCQLLEFCNEFLWGNKISYCHWYENQTGLMCTSCEDGYAYPVYSYSMACVECKNYKYNWLKYIAVAFLPLTVFYIIVVLFRITVTSGAMNGYILICQLLSTPINARILSRTGGPKYTGIYFSFLGIWNLDFFRGLYTPFCLHPKLNTLQTLLLDYIIAVYPLLLVVLTYIFVRLHNRHSIVVRLWSPFYKCFAKLRNNWDINGSLVGAFATFLLLSYVKILNVSFYVLTPNTLYDVFENQMPKRFLYYDGTYEYFGKDHIPYALLAIFMLLVFNIFPLVLLCLYPCRCFQRCLNYCRLQSLTLHIFMDTFNGCYKIQPQDCRYFAGLYVLLRLVNLVLLAMIEGTSYCFYAGCLFVTMIVVVIAIRPYKATRNAIADSVFFAHINMVSLSVYFVITVIDHRSDDVTIFRYIVATILIALHPLYGIGIFTYFLLPKKILLKIKSLLLKCKNFITKQTDSLETDEPRPYRLDHSDEYPPLLPVATDKYINIQYT